MRSDQDHYLFHGRTVHCLLCNNMATIKRTRTNKLMLRCDNCRFLAFANSEDSQDKLNLLGDYRYPSADDCND